MAFMTDQKAIIKPYTGFKPERDKLLESMQHSLPLVEIREIAEPMNSVIRKVNAMTNADFSKIELSNALDTVSPEN